MTKQVWAITTCRVSTPEQLLNKSLDRQSEAVIKAAEELEAIIPEDGQWSGDVSSKAGTNTKRKDLKEMLEYCKKHPQVKYLLVHEVDRFMRSVDELFYFEVRFREEVGVKIIYASQPELNTNDYKAKLFKALEAFKGEASNDERQRKSIAGQSGALKEGRYTFHPKAGYKRGYETGIPELHDVRGPILRNVLIRIATKRVTPTQGLIELNNSDYTKTRAPLKMDKFRIKVIDPFYAGIVDIDKQVKVHNENGLHEPLITKEQHYELIRIMDDKKKNQTGPRKDGNPKYPLNMITMHDTCLDKKNKGKLVGFSHGNGQNEALVYEKYRCRTVGCGVYWTRDELHTKVMRHFKNNPLTEEGWSDLIDALTIVWKQREGQAEQEINRIRHKILALNEKISNQVEEATDPGNLSIKQDILAAIAKKKEEVSDLEAQLEKLKHETNNDKERFLRFAFSFVENMGSRFLELPQEKRFQCKQIVFPSGFYINSNGKVYTPEISPLYRLALNKKSVKTLQKVQMVRVKRL